MCALAIRAEGIGKKYRIGTAAERQDTLRDVLGNAVKAPFKNLARLRRADTFAGDDGEDTVWALRDITFDVRHGEVLGIVGKNGAGKSTLLKVLSRITDPSAGRAEVHGRVGSLLEVGTGFHPELTGRENVFLNGSILGMDRPYIERRFDEIVEFSGVGKFIDTPVKRYSSGMYLRLAFAVAAHLEPEILIIDEVLAVGDIEFQRKCIGKMSEVAGHGRTVIFVSHNMGAVAKLCDRAILLRGGRNVMDAPARDVVQAYLVGDAEREAERRWEQGQGPGDATCRLRGVRIVQNGQPSSRLDIRGAFDVEVEYETAEPFSELLIGVDLTDGEGTPLMRSTHDLADESLAQVSPGVHVSRLSLPAGALNVGSYWVGVFAEVPAVRTIALPEQHLRFDVDLTCPRMSRHVPGWFKGPLGPRLGVWSHDFLDV